MTQPRLLPDYAAVPTRRERTHARATNRAAQLGMFDQFADDLVALADEQHAPCAVCASAEHVTDACQHGTAPTLDLVDVLTVCTTCAAPHRGDACDNPACPDNPTHTPERRAAIIERTAAYRAEQAERAERARLYGLSFQRSTPQQETAPMHTSTSAQRDENRLTPADLATMAAAVEEFARQTPTMGTGERFTTAERIAHRAIGCDERDLRASEILAVRQMFKPILAAHSAGRLTR